MKFKGLAILLSIYLLFTQIGYGYVLHFCQNQLSSVKSLFETNTSDKDCCGELLVCCETIHEDKPSTHDGCCNDIIIITDVDDNLPTFFDFDFQQVFFVVQSYLVFTEFFILKEKPLIFLINQPAHAPPLYALFSQRLFYS